VEQYGEKSTGIAHANNVQVFNNNGLDYGDSLIAEVLIMLGQVARPIGLPLKRPESAYKINTKLDHNCLIKYRYLVEERFDWYHVEEIFGKLDKSSNKGDTIKGEINSTYIEIVGDLKVKNKGVPDIEIIRENADAIIDHVITNLVELVIKTKNKGYLSIEQIRQGIRHIVAFCIVDCKVLEEPPKEGGNDACR